jgi:predicted MarR family transcription regulator
MRTVSDEDGNRYLLEKESALVTASRAVPEPVRRAVTATHDERALGLLVQVDRRGPFAVRTLLADLDCCESDLHGMLAEFRAAGLLAETTVAGERGYETTADGETAVATLVDPDE